MKDGNFRSASLFLRFDFERFGVKGSVVDEPNQPQMSQYCLMSAIDSFGYFRRITAGFGFVARLIEL